MSSGGAFVLLGCLALVAGGWGVVRYRTPFNPLTCFVVAEVGLELLSAAAMTLFPTHGFADRDVVTTAVISMVEVVGVTLPFLSGGSLPAALFSRGMRFLGLDTVPSGATRFSRARLNLLLVSAVLCLWALAVLGGGGMLWLTDPRTAYDHYRHPAGVFWVLAEAFLTFALIYSLWSRRPRGIKLLLAVTAFAVGGWFTGSKGYVLSVLVIGAAYYEFRIRRIPLLGWAVFGGLMLGLVQVLLVLHGFPAEDTLKFFDYFADTVMYISRHNDFGTYYGVAWLSSFWVYVPRIMFPAKPYHYGDGLITGVLFPGAAEQGFYPALAGWALAHLDFGILGVFCAGVAKALWFRGSYEYFLDHRANLFAFEYMTALSLSRLPIFGYAPFLYFVLWTLGQSLFLRMVWSAERPQARQPAGLLPSLAV